jgi:eukaryotic-like serine/threonine-protein kinase
MEAEQWTIVAGLFHQALDLPVHERGRFIGSVEKEHPDLVEELNRMLNSHYASGTFLTGTALDNIIVQKGERIGPWKVLEEIGRGGMSSVYLAERSDGSFSRKVAIKFLHGLIPGQDMVARLKAEQNILARLDHNNICKLLDAGINDDGRPFFIMEYIDGVPADIWCRNERLTIREKLDLFLQICDAVQYAHQHLIVHRDLKPSNILVDRHGTVKLLDFGIAKLLEQDTGHDIPKTHTGLYLMTPEYASPEQVNLDPITTASDVYTLGLILCEMLTGFLPYDVSKKSPAEVSRIVAGLEPVKPSTLVQRSHKTATQNQNSQEVAPQQARNLAKTLKGDLDNIVLKALRKVPERRYSSVEQLKQDISNYRSNKPVIARAESFGYRAGKFIRRNKTGVGFTLALFFVLMASTAIALRQAGIADEQRQIAEQRFEDVRKLAGSILFEFHDAIADLPGSTAAREVIVDRALDYLGQLSVQDASNTDLSIEVAAAWQRIGDVQGNPTNANLGRQNDALDSYKNGLDLLEEVLRTDPDHVIASQIYANIYEKKGDVQGSLGQLEQAEASHRYSVEVYRRLAERFPGQPERQIAYSISLLKMGDLLGNPNYPNRGKADEALDVYMESKEILLAVRASNPQNAQVVRPLGLIFERIGTMHESRRDFDNALVSFRESMELRIRYAELNPANTDAIRDQAVAYEKMGLMYRQAGNLDAALDHYQKSFEIFKWLAETDPRNLQARQSLAISYIHLGDLAYHPDRLSFNKRELARSHFEISRELLNINLQVDSTNNHTRNLLNLIEHRMSVL